MGDDFDFDLPSLGETFDYVDGLFEGYGSYDNLGFSVARIVRAAIEADMEIRNWDYQGNQTWRRLGIEVRWNGSSLEAQAVPGYGSIEPLESPYEAEQRQELLDGLLQELVDDVFTYYETEVPALFERWQDLPHPEAFSGAIQALHTGAEAITLVAGANAPGATGEDSPGGTGSVGLGTALDNLVKDTGKLEGRAVDVFSDYFATPLRYCVPNQLVLCTALDLGLSGTQATFAAARTDVAQVARSAEWAMKESVPADSSGSDITIALTVFSAVAGVAGAAFTGGASLALTAASLGAAATETILGALATSPDDRDPSRLSADHPRDVVGKIRSALEDIDAGIVEQETALEGVLRDFEGATHEPATSSFLQGSTNFEPPRPEILDVTDASQVLWDYSSRRRINLVRETVNDISTLWIPEVVGALGTCRSGLVAESGPFQRAGGVGIGYSGCWAAYDALQDRVAEILTDVSRHAAHGGEALLLAMQHVGNADDDADAALREHAAMIDRMEARERRQEQAEANRPRHIQPPGGFGGY